MKILFKAYLVSFAFFTFANYGGFIPISLILIILISFLFFFQILYSKKISVTKFDFADMILLIFLIISTISYFTSTNTDLNFNHLIAHYFVFIFFYFAIKIYLFNLSKRELLKTISLYFDLIFYTIVSTTLVDYVLFGLGINLADYLPLETRNIVFGESWGVRARGFFVEPTDLALALNIYGPLYIGFKMIQKHNAKFYIGIFLYVSLLILTRSSSGFFEILCSLSMIVFHILLQKKDFKISFKYSFFKKAFILIFITFIGYLIFKDSLSMAIMELSRKFDFLNSNFDTGDVRVEYWVDAVGIIKSFSTHELLIGSGTGYTSWNVKTFNWYLTIFVENGLLGIVLIFLFFISKIYKCFNIKSNIKYFYFVAIFSTFLHLFSQVGYFYPYVWFPFAMLDLFYCRFNDNLL
jgi:hypothetical protein